MDGIFFYVTVFGFVCFLVLKWTNCNFNCNPGHASCFWRLNKSLPSSYVPIKVSLQVFPVSYGAPSKLLFSQIFLPAKFWTLCRKLMHFYCFTFTSVFWVSVKVFFFFFYFLQDAKRKKRLEYWILLTVYFKYEVCDSTKKRIIMHFPLADCLCLQVPVLLQTKLFTSSLLTHIWMPKFAVMGL